LQGIGAGRRRASRYCACRRHWIVPDSLTMHIEKHVNQRARRFADSADSIDTF
jgi:hypothetical protein